MLSLSLDNLSADQIFSDIFPEVMPEERSIRDIVTDSFAEHLSLRDFSADSFAHDLNAFNQNGGDEDILHLPGEEEIKRGRFNYPCILLMIAFTIFTIISLFHL